ncbi:MAG TPA: amidase [Planctomycetota bacterium]|jgi:Asp-tRNA(Asn)/Glu-tRNA(Gln) amidotransferase A subunit family amidase|nr:amidase [Planctomycetota bacterium]
MKVASPSFQPKPIALPDASKLERPANLEDLAFADIPTLAALVKSRKITCLDLTKMYLARLKRLDAKLHMIVNLTEERALAQAAERDKELADGKWRGLLHGIPWGAKDLLAVKGAPTTWGSKIYEHQVIDADATVVKRLDEAGAVLLGKLSLGEFAYGDLWFGGRTRNPWNPEQGSSGSSAGPAAATASGCVAFSIGSETLGSIVSPCTRCGATGLRPTFGRVPRTGSMALSWTMDKLGPICRTVQDATIVLAAIQGPDDLDPTAQAFPFAPPGEIDVRGWKVGYTAKDFERSPADQHVLDELKALGVELVPIELPASIPAGELLVVLTCEAAAAFDELTRDGRDAQMVWQADEAWPNTFRATRLVPAIEYLRAMRLRTELMREMDKVFQKVDLYVHPSFGGDTLVVANLTGHPTICAPSGLDEKTKSPRSIGFTGRLFGETQLAALAQAWQRSTRFHLAHPSL